MWPSCFFPIILSTRLQNDSYAFKLNTLEILFHFSSKGDKSGRLFGLEVAFLFSKTLRIAQSRGSKSALKSSLIAVLIVFSWNLRAFL